MKRREFITILGSAAAAWPFAARAQQQVAIPVIGLLLHAVDPEMYIAAFIRGLAETGYVEGRNVAIEYRNSRGDFNQLPELAADLVRRRVAVIAVPGSGPAARAAKAATTTIPIVFSVGGDPAELGLVTNFNRPGGNITGFSEMNRDIYSKRLNFLHELMPAATRFAVLVNPSTAQAAPAYITNMQASASAIGLQIEVVYADTDRGIEEAFASLGQKRIEGLVINAGYFDNRVQVATLAARHKIPTIYWDRPEVEAGGLMSYGPSVFDLVHQVGVYTGRILKGEKPGDLPVQQPTKFELIINLKTARALGLNIPADLLAAADEVIE
jgi:putative tryptophan/tyrosine transport system substrate-binding protein